MSDGPSSEALAALAQPFSPANSGVERADVSNGDDRSERDGALGDGERRLHDELGSDSLSLWSFVADCGAGE